MYKHLYYFYNDDNNYNIIFKLLFIFDNDLFTLLYGFKHSYLILIIIK